MSVSFKWILPAFIGLLFLACKKDGFTDNPEAKLQINVDSLHFDTLFTSAGSTTQLIKIYNRNKEGIKVNSVRITGGALSAFKINIDGIPGPQVSNINVAANDSIYVFVTVSIDPTANQVAFLVQDSIEIIYNGNSLFIQLDAYGQNAHFFRNKRITGSEVWNNDLPYVILGRLTVDTSAILIINESCRIYFHADAPFIVNGTLLINGKKDDSTRVLITGDRLDEPYRNFPGSFPGIIFTRVSKNNVINYAVIRNAYQAIIVDQPTANGIHKLVINETIIDNAYDAGIFGLNAGIKARNVLISNCGKNLLLVNGGNYDFTHCTVASFSNLFLQHKEPVLFLANYLNQTAPANALNATFRNCIFWGNGGALVEDEVVVSKIGTGPFNVIFDNVLWRVKTEPVNAVTVGNKINSLDPQFDSVNTLKGLYNFRLKSTSPAVNKGGNFSVSQDLDGALRPIGLPDLGAYEKQ
jgi:hypothetical protein